MRANERVTCGKRGQSHLTCWTKQFSGEKGKEEGKRGKKKEKREAPPSL